MSKGQKKFFFNKNKKDSKQYNQTSHLTQEFKAILIELKTENKPKIYQ